MSTLQEQHESAISFALEMGDTRTTAAANCAAITREQMKDFAEWVVNQKWDKVMKPGYKDDGEPITKTTSELLDLYLESLNKKP